MMIPFNPQKYPRRIEKQIFKPASASGAQISLYKPYALR